jgi:hypothetical protein
MSKRISATRRLNTSIKVAALVAALGFVTVMMEQPRLTASPSSSVASVEQSLYWSDVAGAAMASSLSEPAAAGESRLPTYFPSQFAPPNGEIDSQPPTF